MSDEKKPNLPSTTDEATNPALDVVTELVLDSTIPAPIRRNALKAFDRLCSALIDVPVGALERRSAEKRAESEARIKIIRENADQIAQQMKVDPKYARIAVSKYGQKILREQVNLDNISAIAADELKSIESDTPTSQNTNEPNPEQSADSPNQETDSGKEKTIDDDWLNVFETEARQKSSEEMHLRFGRILAGEIENPGSYSIKSIKLLGELNQYTAALFKKLCSMCIAFEDPADRCVIDARLLPLDRNVAQGDLGKYSFNPYEIDLLSQYNLVGSTQNSLYPYNLCIGSENNRFPQPFQHQGQDWVLWPFSQWDAIKEFYLMGLPFSLIGSELFRIVAQDPMPEYTEDLKKFFAKQNLNMFEVNSP